jgi:hypothetical protein
LVQYSLYNNQNIVVLLKRPKNIKLKYLILSKIFVLTRTLNIPEEAQKLSEKHDFEIQAYKFGTIFNEQLRTPR